MFSDYQPPLTLHFVWHPSDNEVVSPILDMLRVSFSRDVDRPFSRGLNIPLFFYSSKSNSQTPENIPISIAKKNIVFIFTSQNTIGRPKMYDYIDRIKSNDSLSIVPIAIDNAGLHHKGSLDGLNCIRLYDWPVDQRVSFSLVYLSHEIFRQGFSHIEQDEPGKTTSINLFLSHAKAGGTGIEFSENIKAFIDNTNMNRFFDSTEISPGFSFDDEIEKYIPKSTLIIIETDAYSSRYWCQREILCAKRHNRPIIVINCLEKYEDRIFPAASNVPCLHIAGNTRLSNNEVLTILSGALLETIRHNLSLTTLEYFKTQGWIPNDCEITSRPPEIRQVLDWKNNGVDKACYPDPPIYPDEADWHKQLEFDAFTPLWSPSENDSLRNLNIGISISDFESDGFQKNHQHFDTLNLLAQDIARNLLSRSATLLYGGDLREGGFTEFLLDEAMILQDRLKIDLPPIQNHLAWPLHISDEEIVTWRAKYRSVMKTEEYPPPSDVLENLDATVFLPPSCPENLYIWSRCLTDMRTQSVELSDARICVGGRVRNFKGKMPGVLEEVLIALEKNKPIYLLGGFGGAVGEISKIISTKQNSQKINRDWQAEHTSGYADLQRIASQNNNHADYDEIITTLTSTNYSDLATKSGLSETEYSRLMASPFPDECLHLIIKGLKNIRSHIK